MRQDRGASSWSLERGKSVTLWPVSPAVQTRLSTPAVPGSARASAALHIVCHEGPAPRAPAPACSQAPVAAATSDKTLAPSQPVVGPGPVTREVYNVHIGWSVHLGQLVSDPRPGPRQSFCWLAPTRATAKEEEASTKFNIGSWPLGASGVILLATQHL